MDLQLNITATKKVSKKPSNKVANKVDYKFVSNPKFVGKTLARKRPNQHIERQNADVPQKKIPKFDKPEPSEVVAINLRDLSENKGKFQGKNYQDLNDDLHIKKVRSGGWISSLFKNNPEVPRVGQRAVKPLVEKVFAGKNFTDLEIHLHSVANLQQNLGLKELMVVQQQAIPLILNGRDVLIRSQTGSGKTLSYALPIVEGLQAIRPKINRHDGIRAIVVVPTRELAVQTYELLIKLVKPFTWVVPGLLSGGQKRKAEKARLRKGLNILVGTPGRINDHLRHTQSLNFAKTGCLILDEADRLLDMGYEKDVAAIVKAIEDHKKSATYDPLALIRQNSTKKVLNEEDENPATENDDEEKVVNKHPLTDIFISDKRQTILLSATLTKAVENLAGLTMVDPVFVDTSEGRAVVADSLNSLKVESTEIVKPPETKKLKKDKVKLSNDNETMLDINPDKMIKTAETGRRRGLKEFSGAMHPELFESGERKAIVSNVPENDSDSDSDYEYYKSQKDTKIIEEEEETGEVELNNTGNNFAQALKSALIDDELILPATVNQTFLVVPMKLRLVTLCSLIVEHCVFNKKGGKMIVFMATLEMVDYHTDLIETVLTGKEVGKKKSKGKDSDEEMSDSEYHIDYDKLPEGGLVPVDIDMFKLHGSMPHEQRIEVFKQFRLAKAGVLICTDVAARGLDVPHVDLVLQYCAPASATDYVHRVGRTGRATRVGAAAMLLLPSETDFVRYLEKKRIRLRQTEENRCLETLRKIAPSATSTQRAAIAVQARLEHVAHSDREWMARASRAYTSWVRFYSGYPRDVKEHLDSRKLHLGHAAKAFALRETPAMLAKRAKLDPKLMKEKPTNRLTVHEDLEKKRPGFPRVKAGKMGMLSSLNKQSSMHTASEFDSGLNSFDTGKKKKKNK